MAFKIITDSATDLPKEIVEKYKLHVIPTPVTIDGTDYFDGKTIFPEDFYRIQAQGTDIKTYHINQYMFRENFEPYAKAGDEVLYMCFSTGIAGTFNAANLAKEELLEEYPEFDLTIIDTKCASLGFGLAVEKILRMQANGAPKDLIIEAAQFFCEHMEHIVIRGAGGAKPRLCWAACWICSRSLRSMTTARWWPSRRCADGISR